MTKWDGSIRDISSNFFERWIDVISSSGMSWFIMIMC